MAANNTVAGVKCSGVSLDWSAAQRQKEKIVGQLTGGVDALLRHNGVRLVNGTAKLLSGHSVKVEAETLEADAVIIATGSESVTLPVPGARPSR